MLPVRVVKLGGNEFDRPAWLAACAAALKGVEPVVVVHGGGQAGRAPSPRVGVRGGKGEGPGVTPPGGGGGVGKIGRGSGGGRGEISVVGRLFKKKKKKRGR